MAEAIRVEGEVRPACSGECGARITVLLSDGRSGIAVCRWPKGHPARLEHVFAAHSSDVVYPMRDDGRPTGGAVPQRISWVDGDAQIDLRRGAA